MVYKLYSIQDTMIGFNAPYIQVNEEVAKREYKNFLKANPNAPDMRLFMIGEFDDETGTLTTMVPTQIMGGGVIEI